MEMRELVKQRIKSCQALPSLPTVALQLLELCQDPSVDLKEMAKLISRDPALTAKVLKIINSPFYGLRTTVTTLSHALTLLGVRSVRTLALSFSLVRSLKKEGKNGFDHNHYWQRSVLAGLGAQTLARFLALPNHEEVFLAGLLQDLGMLVLNESLPNTYGRLVVTAGGDHQRLVDLEKEYLQTDHAEVSAWLSEVWHLPSLFQKAVLGSHDPLAVEAEEDQQPVVRCVAVASWLAEIWLLPDNTQASQTARLKAQEWLEMQTSTFEQVLEQMADRLPGVLELFEATPQSSEEIDAILDRAKEALLLLSLETEQQARETEATIGSLASENEELKERSQRDPLTGLYNRAHLEAVLDQEFDRSSHLGRPLSVVFCDIDNFKKFNDTYGHPAGDSVLKTVAQILKKRVRPLDLAARYGGEEFVVVLPDTSSSGAAAVAERLRIALAEVIHTLKEGESVVVTASFGYATHMEAERFPDAAALLEAADQALYAAKGRGRNLVVGHGTYSLSDEETPEEPPVKEAKPLRKLG